MSSVLFFLLIVRGLFDKNDNQIAFFQQQQKTFDIHLKMFRTNIWFQCINYWFVFLISEKKNVYIVYYAFPIRLCG